MRAFLPLALLLAGCTAPARDGAGGGAGGGIVSTNPCADAILIELVDPARITAISQYSHNPAASSIAVDVARRFPATAGTAEEVIALRPSLVLTSSFTPLATRAAYERAGLKTLVMDSPVTVAASKVQIEQVAAAVGAQARGRALNARIDAAAQAATPKDGKRPAALLFIAGDLVNGSGTLLDQLLTHAGFRDAAADYGLASTGSLPIETIIAKPPRVIMTPDATARTAALRRRVLARTGANTTEVAFPRNLVNCGGPTIIPALAELAKIRRSLS
ncbi:ABC transporter substrate-binding protein [Sphingomonas sp.]|uniref:ABC transporter substrate-binding protein n=1 Tax=Sphingomonas sp. TaxID=28214 RepID=UPI003D6CAC80